MKKKSLLIMAIVVVLSFAGCSGEKGKTVGTPGGKGTSEAADGKGNSVAVMSPEQKELVGHLRTAHKDEISAQLVEQGYYYEVNESNMDGIFQIDFKAVTGDMTNPMLVFDVYVNDAELTAEYDEIRLYAYTLGDEAYNISLDSYAPCEGIGKADELQDNLYHVTMPGASAWMTMGKSFVVDVCQIDFVKKGRNPVSYPVNMPETGLTVPQTKFHPVLELGYTGFSFIHGGREYVLKTAEYGPYRTGLYFWGIIDKDAVPMNPVDFAYLDDSSRLGWKDFLSDMALEVDGAMYYVQDNGSLTFSEGDVTEEEYRGRGFAYMPGVNFAKAEEAKIWVGTVGYDLKSGSKTPLLRELPTATPTPVPIMEAEQAELAEHLRGVCKDEISAGLVEQGYYYIVNENREAEIFRFDFMALTGDEENLMMVFDVYVEDEVLTEMYPVLRLDACCQREESYEPADWWNSSGYGVQNPENKKLYHVIMSGYNFGYASTITEICRIAFDVDTDSTNGELVYEVNPEPYRTDIPLSVFAPVLRGQYYGMEFACDGRTYELVCVVYGQYDTDVMLRTVIDAEDVPADDTKLWNYREELQKEWAKVYPSLILMVDGKEYRTIDEEGKRGYIWFNTEEGKDSYQGEVHPFFPAIDYGSASVIELKAGDMVYRLK